MPVTLSIVSPSPEQGNTSPISLSPDDLALMWGNETGFDVLPYHRRYFAQWLEEGFEDTVIMLAMQETFNAPRPTFVYLQSIMANLRRERAFSLDAYAARQSAFRRRISSNHPHNRY